MKITGYDDPVCVPRPQLFVAYNPPQWYVNEKEWMSLDAVESYMRALEWAMGRLPNEELLDCRRLATSLNARNNTTSDNGRMILEGDLRMTCEPSILIEIVDKELAYRKEVDFTRVTVVRPKS